MKLMKALGVCFFILVVFQAGAAGNDTTIVTNGNPLFKHKTCTNDIRRCE